MRQITGYGQAGSARGSKSRKRKKKSPKQSRTSIWIGRKAKYLYDASGALRPNFAHFYLDAIRTRLDRIRLPLASSLTTALVIAGLVLTAFVTRNLPRPAELYPIEKTLPIHIDRELVLLTNTGETFARRRSCLDAPVAFAELPDHFVQALLAIEDQRFYYHPGVDPIGILRAGKANMDAGRVVQGGSTLTQQLAKMAYLSNERTIERKVEEALIALWLEVMLTKEQIMARYLSSAYFGEGCYGLRAASRHYFSTRVSELNVSQSAFLVALLRAPSAIVANRDYAMQRAELVIQVMRERAVLGDAPLPNGGVAVLSAERHDEQGSYFADWLAGEIETPQTGDLAPLPLDTSFDAKLQALAEKAVGEALAKYGKRRKIGQAALVAMRPDGRVVAMVGGRDYEGSQYNRATQALRQPGSSFKTFVYLAALRSGIDPYLQVRDEPIQIGDWSPKNYGKNYRGAVSVTKAFASSINTVAVRLSEAVGREQVIATAEDMGIDASMLPTPSIALGVSEVSLLELTSAYASIAACAYPVKPWGAMRASSEAGDEPAIPPGSGKWRLEKCQEMRGLLRTVVTSGTGRGARVGVPAYGKTGTSQDFRDAWFVGFAGNLVVGVWVGNDDNTSMRRVTGGSVPASIWRQFVNQARRADENFERHPKKIADFEAQPRGTRFAAINWSALRARPVVVHRAPNRRVEPRAYARRGLFLPPRRAGDWRRYQRDRARASRRHYYRHGMR